MRFLGGIHSPYDGFVDEMFEQDMYGCSLTEMGMGSC